MATALIVSCADGRLREYLLALETRLDIDGADRLLVPGGPLALLQGRQEATVMLGWLDLLVRGHALDLVCLVGHEDCFAYTERLVAAGDLGERSVVERDVRAATRLVAGRHASLRVEGFIVPRDPAGRSARFGAPERLAL